MKFLRSLFGGGAQKAEEKGDELRLDLEYKDAAYFYSQALEKLDDDETEAVERVQTKLREVRRNAVSQIVEEAIDLAEANETSLAHERLELAMNFADEPSLKEEIERRLEALDETLGSRAPHAETPDETSGTEGELFELALSGLAPADRETALTLGESFRVGYEACQNEEWSTSLGHFVQAMREHPEEPLILEFAGLAHERLGEPSQALEHYRAAHALASERPATVQGMAAAYRALENRGKALDVLTEAASTHPISANLDESWVEIHLDHAMALSEGSHHDDAIGTLLSLLEVPAAEPGNVYYNLAGVLERAGRQEETRTALERAIEVSPRQALYKERLADYLVRRGLELDDALRLLIEANQVETTAGAGMLGGSGSKATVSPNRPRYLYKIARVYYLKGEDLEAEKTITTALAVCRDPQVTTALEELREELNANRESGAPAAD